jgi:hypothetical protein
MARSLLKADINYGVGAPDILLWFLQRTAEKAKKGELLEPPCLFCRFVGTLWTG